jgi:hypothetical protein
MYLFILFRFFVGDFRLGLDAYETVGLLVSGDFGHEDGHADEVACRIEC